MFLLVSVRHLGAHQDEHQHGVSIQISINFGKIFLRISRIRNIPLTWILARVFAYLPPFISQILNFIYWTVFIFIFIYFEWRDTENQLACVQTSNRRRLHAGKKPTKLFSKRPKFTFAQSKRFPPKHNLHDRENNSSEQVVFWHEVKVLSCPSISLFYTGEVTMKVGRCTELEELFARANIC